MEDPNIKIVRFGGGELAPDDASAGGYFFAAGPEPETIYAFDKSSAGASQTPDDLMTWARERGLEETLAHDHEPDDDEPPVDPKAEIAEAERVRRDLAALANETGLALGPELLAIAKERRIFGSVLMFREPFYRWPPVLPLSRSASNLGLYGWDLTQSCVAFGHDVVRLYEQANYGPNPPIFTLFGLERAGWIPNGRVGSVRVA